jgi:hypothetical protein
MSKYPLTHINFVEVFCRGEEDWWLCQLTHGVKLCAVAGRVVELIQFFPSCGGELALCGAALLIPRLPLRPLQFRRKMLLNTQAALCPTPPKGRLLILSLL